MLTYFLHILYMLMINMLKADAFFFEKNTGKENDRKIFVVPKSKIRILERVKKG